ncbi:hypothetical protein JCM8115_003432 [Rhodotorula mucilaginosa]|uniref:Uncharacterized protein n=1 Tax=Rhodotorula mucilaginosa TaxID=5537 RepID=A0A9P6VUH4_RHOMI|nr:hypothetical protein C6P46_001639 [Rhodotorula mucilaginosa]TKA58295.1 hypothetical protein B0A53_00032 [Rhodotorula sp. CCFEE 5036]
MPPGIPNEPARLCLLGSLPPAEVAHPPRVRLVGRVAALLPEVSLAVLVDTTEPAAAVLIDLSSPVLRGGRAPPRLKDRIMVTGQVTRPAEPITTPPALQVPLPVPITRPLDLDTVIQVERFEPCEDLDMEQWRAAVRAVQRQVVHRGTSGRDIA